LVAGRLAGQDSGWLARGATVQWGLAMGHECIARLTSGVAPHPRPWHRRRSGASHLETLGRKGCEGSTRLAGRGVCSTTCDRRAPPWPWWLPACCAWEDLLTLGCGPAQPHAGLRRFSMADSRGPRPSIAFPFMQTVRWALGLAGLGLTGCQPLVPRPAFRLIAAGGLRMLRTAARFSHDDDGPCRRHARRRHHSRPAVSLHGLGASGA
jgi:hypothetical protein